MVSILTGWRVLPTTWSLCVSASTSVSAPDATESGRADLSARTLPCLRHFADPLTGAFRSITDLELLHHYSTCSCVRFPSNTILHKGARRRAWAHRLSRAYLLHQILSVAALHLYVEDPRRTDLSNVATHHRALALNDVQSNLSNVTSDSCSISLFAFAGLTAES